MSNITNYIDVSTKSLALAAVVFLIVVGISKYLLDSYNSSIKEEEKRSSYITWMYAIILGLIFGLISLFVFKQFCKFGTCDILTDPFPIRG